MKKIHKTKRERTLLSEAVFGVITSLFTFILLSLILAAFLLTVNEPVRWMGVSFVTAFLFSAATTGIIMAKRCKDFGMYPTLIGSLSFVILCLILSLIFSGFGLPLLLSYGLYVLISIICFNLGAKKSKKRRRRA